MTSKEIKKTLKENGAARVRVNKVKFMGNYQFGISNFNFDEISKEKLTSLFPTITISSQGQAWL